MGTAFSHKAHAGGSLFITVYQAFDLPKDEKSFCYVRLICGKYAISTEKQSSSNPEFIERFHFPSVLPEQLVTVQAWQSSVFGRNKLLGETEIPLTPFFGEERIQPFRLLNSKQADAGEIVLSISLFATKNDGGFKSHLLSSDRDGIIHPAEPLQVPIDPNAPPLPQYVCIDFPELQSILDDPETFTLFLLTHRKQQKEDEQEEVLELETAIGQLISRRKSIPKSQIDDIIQNETSIQRLLTVLQTKADTSLLNLNENEEEAYCRVLERSDHENQVFQAKWKVLHRVAKEQLTKRKNKKVAIKDEERELGKSAAGK
ncbi:hypothetical protein BLNAU_1757 [Blattamonas nauphoetae]|uniref:C2 domain-containing protein n=1 Tax=Blattamonas nauphoetae TaxID=2049346 RepID=A0ABQ9YHJ9_9EUKA|nr:hypothetical protein BLNAU_1757 [Blattamonas nauphoetae]